MRIFDKERVFEDNSGIIFLKNFPRENLLNADSQKTILTVNLARKKQEKRKSKNYFSLFRNYFCSKNPNNSLYFSPLINIPCFFLSLFF